MITRIFLFELIFFLRLAHMIVIFLRILMLWNLFAFYPKNYNKMSDVEHLENNFIKIYFHVAL